LWVSAFVFVSVIVATVVLIALEVSIGAPGGATKSSEV